VEHLAAVARHRIHPRRLLVNRIPRSKRSRLHTTVSVIFRWFNTPRSECNFSAHGGVPPRFPERHTAVGMFLRKEAGADCLCDNIVVRVDRTDLAVVEERAYGDSHAQNKNIRTEFKRRVPSEKLRERGELLRLLIALKNCDRVDGSEQATKPLDLTQTMPAESRWMAE